MFEEGSRSSMMTLRKQPLKLKRNMYFPLLETRGRALDLSYG